MIVSLPIELIREIVFFLPSAGASTKDYLHLVLSNSMFTKCLWDGDLEMIKNLFTSEVIEYRLPRNRIKTYRVFINSHKRHGLCTVHFITRLLVKETPYVDGKRHGQRKKYNRGTPPKLSKIQEYTNGKRNGVTKEWDKHSNFETLLSKQYFQNDLPHGRSTWWANEQILCCGNFVKGIRDGVWIWYHVDDRRNRNDPPGEMYKKGRYSKGIKVGVWKINGGFGDQSEIQSISQKQYSDQGK